MFGAFRNLVPTSKDSAMKHPGKSLSQLFGVGSEFLCSAQLAGNVYANSL